MKFKGILKERKLWVKIAALIVAAFLMYYEVLRGQYIYIPLAILVMVAVFFRKEHVISKEGVDIDYIIFESVHQHHLWTWDEIDTLHVDRRKAKPNVMLHIGKDVVVRTFTFRPEDVDGIVELAKAMNPRIYIENPTEEEQEREYEEILHRQEIAKAQRAAAKRKKKK